MGFLARSFLVPKSGNTPNECEDAIGCNVKAGKFAVSDGATEAFDSRRWAKFLVKSWVSIPPEIYPDLSFLVAGVEELGKRLAKRWLLRQLPWYAEEKSKQGAYAAFVGIHISTFPNCESRYEWRAVALGDSCLFYHSDGRLIFAAPLSSPALFSYHPILVPSLRIGPTTDWENRVYFGNGLAQAGDCFLLLSDALAQWYLTYSLEDADLTDKFLAITANGTNKDFSDFCEEERSCGRLRNDDMAVLRIDLIAPRT